MTYRGAFANCALLVALSGQLAGCGPNNAVDVASLLHQVPQPNTQELTAACSSGTPVPEAGAYAGSLHYVGIATYSNEWNSEPGNSGWVAGGLESTTDPRLDSVIASSDPVQLIVCLTVSWSHISCGVATRDDGVQGEALAGQETDTIKIVVAATGKTLMSRKFTDPWPDTHWCPSYAHAPGGTPPWYIGHQSAIDTKPEIDYILAAATQTSSPATPTS